MIIIKYYIKLEPCQSRKFETEKAAKRFCQYLNDLKECEAYELIREK